MGGFLREEQQLYSDLIGALGNPEQRDTVLEQRLGLSRADISACRRGDMTVRVHEAAQLLARNREGVHISSASLSAIVFPEWQDLAGVKLQSRRVRAALACYSKEKEALERTFQLPTTLTHMLRVAVGAYSGNLVEARKRWPRFQPSPEDWQRSVRIPLELDRDATRLLGAYWASATLPIPYKGDIRFSVKLSEKALYEAQVLPLLRRVHQIEASFLHPHEPGYNGKRSSNEMLQLSSKAVATWLMEDLGLSMEGRASPRVALSDGQKREFLSGILMVKASRNRANEIYVMDTDASLVTTAHYLLRELGIDSRVNDHGGVYQLALSPRNAYLAKATGIEFAIPRLAFETPARALLGYQRKTEMLSLLEQSPERQWSASELLSALDIERREGFKLLADLRKAGIVQYEERRYRAKPGRELLFA